MEKVLSIITPVFNRADCVVKCLESVARQQVPAGWSFEHVVQDDGSTDSTADLVESFASIHKKVSFERFPGNRGTNAARNAAIKRARGKWIVFLDSDDEMLPGAVMTIGQAIDANPDFAHIVFPTEVTEHLSEILGERGIMTFQDFLLGKYSGDFVHVFLRENALLYPFDEYLRIFEVINFLRLYKKAGKILFQSQPLYSRDRQRADSVSLTLRLISDDALERKKQASLLMLEMFRDDYKATDEGRIFLSKELNEIYKLCVLAGDYKAAEKVQDMGNAGDFSSAYRMMHKTKLGRTAWFFAKNILRVKHALAR